VTLDPEGNRTSVQTPKGPTTNTTYDELGKPLDITQPPPKPAEESPVTHFRYDENRNVVQMEDADGRTTKLDYDELNRLFRTTRDPGGLDLVTETTDFDEDGHPLRIAEANGEVTRQTWDELGRLARRTHELPASGWTAPWAYTTDERYHYDPNSNLERVEETDVRKDGSTPPVRVTKRDYDKLDRQTSEMVTLQDETTSSVTTAYWKDGRVKSVTDPRGVTSYTYDGQGREETVATSGGVTRKTYYPDGLGKDITFANGTKRAHAYDKADRLLTIVTTKDEAAVASTAYTYDANGNRLTEVQTNGGVEETTVYTYDDVDRLWTVTYAPDATHPNGRKVTYGLDGAGNRKTEVVTDPQTEAVFESKTGQFDNANRLTELTDNLDASQTTTLAWDRNGNLLSETKAGVTTSYRYDLRDTLAEVERGGQPLARFLGDFDERRVLKIGDPTRPGGSGVQEYVYNGSRLILDVENGQPVSRYEWTNEELVSLLQSGGQRRYFALDGLETVLALTDEAGQATDRLNFDAWGVPKEGTDFGTSGSRFAFTSHRFDTELNLYYAGGRMYSPTIGRFISQDTLSLDPNNPDTWNLFNYVRANPTRYIDPTGHMADAATIKNDFQADQCAKNPSACPGQIDLGNPRVQGAMRLAGGLGMLLSGVAAAPESFGASLLVLGVGFDQAITGLVEVVTGKNQKSVAHQVVEKTHLALGTKPEDAGRAGQAAEVMSLLVAGGAGLWAEGAAAPSAMAEVGESGRVSTLPLADAPRAMHFDPPLPGVAASEGPVVQSFPEWRVGDPITKLTSTGDYPAWYARAAADKPTTVQGRYWMNRAATAAPDEFTQQQLRSMQAGFSPEAKALVRVNKTGAAEVRTISKELHHARGGRGVPGFDTPMELREVWPWEHGAIDSQRRPGYTFLDFVKKDVPIE